MIKIDNVYSYCSEEPYLIENYQEAINDKSHTWLCHHRLETHDKDGNWLPLEKQLLKKDLIERNLYYHRPASELIFLKKKDHQRFHRSGERMNRATVWTKEKRKQQSERMKKVPKTPEWNKKNSESCIKRHAFYILLPDGTITTTREFVLSQGLKPDIISWFTRCIRLKNKCTTGGVTYYALPLGKNPYLPTEPQ